MEETQFTMGQEAYQITLSLLEKGLGKDYSCFSVAVVQKDKILLRTAKGNRQTFSGEKGNYNLLPITENTLYDLASVSKLVSTTQVALRLLEEGEITLYDNMSHFFSDSGNFANVNIRNLMTHTSGITPHFRLSEICKNQEEVASAILHSKPICKPNEDVHYSCMGYILLQKILEKVTNTSLDKLAKDIVFNPLSMKTACYNPKEKDVSATEFTPRHNAYICGEVHDENAYFLGGVSGNAGVFASLNDMIAFGKMLSCRGEGFLSPRTFEKAIHNYTQGMSENRGLGFSLNCFDLDASGDLISPNSYGHNGFTGTSIYCDEKTGICMILLTNSVHYGRENRDNFFRNRRIFHNLALLESDQLLQK